VDGIDRMAPDWELSYVYDRWRPTLFASASRATDFFPGRLTDGGATRTVAVREQQVEAGMLLPVRHVRVVHRALFSALHSSARYTPVDGAGAAARTAVRFGWATSSARRYGYSVSQEHGVAVGATAELARSTIAGAGVDTTVTADVRGYAPTPLAHHVFAIRAAGGWTNAADAIGRRFILGGSGPAGDVMSFDREAFSMLRGFGSARVAGSRIAVMNLDYRWPIARPQRGVGTWPGFLHTVHGAVFLDAGHAWTRAFRRADVKSAVGAELSVDIVAGYGLPLTLTVGAARTRGGREGNRAVYARVGRPF
jgi:hypothetical protein